MKCVFYIIKRGCFVIETKNDKIYIVVGKELHELACSEYDVVSQNLGVRLTIEKALELKEEKKKEFWFKIVVEVWNINGDLIKEIID